MPVWHIANPEVPEGAVYVGRPSRWGNPYHLADEGERIPVVDRYRRWLWSEIRAGRVDLDELAALHEADLVCYCAPRLCHADILLAAAAAHAVKVTS